MSWREAPRSLSIRAVTVAMQEGDRVSGETLHRLAARTLIRDLEQLRGAFRESRYGAYGGGLLALVDAIT